MSHSKSYQEDCQAAAHQLQACQKEVGTCDTKLAPFFVSFSTCTTDQTDTILVPIGCVCQNPFLGRFGTACKVEEAALKNCLEVAVSTCMGESAASAPACLVLRGSMAVLLLPLCALEGNCRGKWKEHSSTCAIHLSFRTDAGM